MKPRHERLNERLEAPDPLQRKQFRSPLPEDRDPEMEEILGLAQYLHASPAFKVEQDFAQDLEQRLIAHASQRHVAPATRRGRLSVRSWRVQLACAALLLGLLVALGTVMAAQMPVSGSPLSFVKHLVLHTQTSPPASATETPQQQAEASLQQASEQLNALASLANPAHDAAYRQALTAMIQQIDTAAQLINALPGGAGHIQLSGELNTLKSTARHTLHGLLPDMTLSERLATTQVLQHLGETIPNITHVFMITVLFPPKQAIVTITGTNLLPGAKLVVDNFVFSKVGVLNLKTYVFIIPWSSTRPPGTVALLNTDGTLVQTTAITFNAQNSSLPPLPTVPPFPTPGHP